MASPPKEIILAESSDIRARLQEKSREIQELRELVGEFTVETQEELQTLSEMLAEVKKRWKELEDEKRAFTQPLSDHLKEIRSWYDGPQGFCKLLESDLKGKIQHSLVSRTTNNVVALQAAEQAHQAGDTAALGKALGQVQTFEKIAGLQTREMWDWRIVDENAVPREYLMIDEKAIRGAMSRTIEAKGAPDPIAGVEFFRRVVIASRTG